MPYPTDSGRLYFFLVISVGLAIYLFFNRKEMPGGYKAASIWFSIGILALLISIVGICTTEDHWDSAFILAFLSFKEVSPKIGIGGLYYLRAMSYSILIMGIATLIFGIKKRRHA